MPTFGWNHAAANVYSFHLIFPGGIFIIVKIFYLALDRVAKLVGIDDGTALGFDPPSPQAVRSSGC